MSTAVPTTRCAHVAIIGRPNVGKSTLLNAIIGSHLSIVTSKPQTTRRRVLGIHTTDTAQLIFVDTPGILIPRYGMQERMMAEVGDTLDMADIIVVVVDAVKAQKRGTIEDPMLWPLLQQRTAPIVLVLNKMDAVPMKREAAVLIEQARLSGLFARAIAISAADGTYVADLVSMLCEMSPEGPFLYDPEMLSTQPERFFVGELIREVIFERFRDEIPYATEVQIVEFKERTQGKWYIAADIVVERETQKAILIGAQGTGLRGVGSQAREAIEEHLQHSVYLELFVKVRNDWRNDRTQLASLGF